MGLYFGFLKRVLNWYMIHMREAIEIRNYKYFQFSDLETMQYYQDLKYSSLDRERRPKEGN